MSEPRRIADTETCFYDFVEAYPQLAVLRFIASFCDTHLQSVQAWQAKEVAFPGGFHLLKLRSLLHIAGYSVTELSALNGDIRQLALLVGTSVVSPEVARSTLGQQPHAMSSTWRILLRNEGIPKGKQEIVKKFVAAKKSRLDAVIQARDTELTAIIDSCTPQTSPVSEKIQLPLDPAVVVSFAGAVRLASSLGHAIMNAGAQQSAYDATRNGQDMAELEAILRSMLDR